MNTAHSSKLIMTGSINNAMDTVDFHELLVRVLYAVYLSVGLLGLSGLCIIVRNVTSCLHFSMFDNVVVALTAVSLINRYGKTGYFLAGIYVVIKVFLGSSKISKPECAYSGIISCDIKGSFPIEIRETDAAISSHLAGSGIESGTDCSTNLVLNESNEYDLQDGSALNDCQHLDCNAEEKIRLSSSMYSNASDECAKNESTMENSKKDLLSCEQKTLTQNSATNPLVSESRTIHQPCPIYSICFPLQEISDGVCSSCAEVATSETLRADEFVPVSMESDSSSKECFNFDSDSKTNTAFLRGKETVQLRLRKFLNHGAFVPSVASGIRKMFSAPSSNVTCHNCDNTENGDASQSSCEIKGWTTDATSTNTEKNNKANCFKQKEASTSNDSDTDDSIETEELRQENPFQSMQTYICGKSRNKDAQNIIADALPNAVDDICDYKDFSQLQSAILDLNQRIKERGQILKGMTIFKTVTSKPIVDTSSNLKSLSSSNLCTKAALVTQDLIEIVDEENENMMVDLVGLSEVICIHDEDDESDIKKTFTSPKILIDADTNLRKRACSVSSCVPHVEKMVSEDDYSFLDLESYIDWEQAFSPDNEYEREKKRARKYN